MATATTFQYQNRNKDEAFVQYPSFLALTTIPENTGNLDLILKYLQVRKHQHLLLCKFSDWETLLAAST
jgi:hypothetical protein